MQVGRNRPIVRPWSWIVAASVALVAFVLSGSAHAQQKTLSGRWRATGMSVQWVIGNWGPACGPKPGGGGAPGGLVSIKQQGGSLAIHGGTRTYRTNTCWDPYPVRSHTGGKRGWRNTCGSAKGDPRQANIVTTMSATDTTIAFDETAQYQFVIKGQNCTASSRKTRSFTLVRREGEAPPEKPKPKPEPTAKPEPKPEPKPAKKCETPGEPARLEVRPSRKLMRPGDEFQFRAIVVDSAGCRLGVSPTWQLNDAGNKAKLLSPGRIAIDPGAAEGKVRLAASVGSQSLQVTIEIASKERYEALLGGGEFNSEGEVDEAAIAVITSGSVGSRTAVSEGDEGSGRVWLLAGAGGFALLLLMIGSILGLRFKKRQQAVAEERRAAEEAAQHAAELAAAEAPPPSSVVAPTQAICPVCGEIYPAAAEFCGKDSAKLLPLN